MRAPHPCACIEVVIINKITAVLLYLGAHEVGESPTYKQMAVMTNKPAVHIRVACLDSGFLALVQCKQHRSVASTKPKQTNKTRGPQAQTTTDCSHKVRMCA